MSAHVISSIVIYPSTFRTSQPALEYVSDWQLFPDQPNDSPPSPFHGDTIAPTGDEDVGGETEMK